MTPEIYINLSKRYSINATSTIAAKMRQERKRKAVKDWKLLRAIVPKLIEEHDDAFNTRLVFTTATTNNLENISEKESMDALSLNSPQLPNRSSQLRNIPKPHQNSQLVCSLFPT